MTLTVDGPDVAPLPAAKGKELLWTSWVALGAVAVALLLTASMEAAGDGFTGPEIVRTLLVLAWTLAGVAQFSRTELRSSGLIVLVGTVTAAASLLATAVADGGSGGASQDLAAFFRTIGLALVPAVAFHFLAALPRGLLVTRWRRWATVGGYVVALAVGVALGTVGPPSLRWPLVAVWAVAVLTGFLTANHRYTMSTGVERQRLQWLGCAVVVVVETALVIIALRLLVGWPESGSVAAGAFTALIPGALVVSTSRHVGRVDRVLLHTVSVVGLTGVVVAVYLVVVLGLGRVPDDDERSVLLLSMAAAGVCALLYPPARERLTRFSNNLVYGEREAPDELLRTFGGRLSRAIPLDELLLQLAESLRKGMRLTSAEVWTGSDGVLERVVSVPDRPVARLALTQKEEPVVARAGVSGPAWLRVWLPALLEGRQDADVRMAPVTNSGQLLGMLVAERKADGERFSEDEERALIELARQVGLALHNVQLDSALQASLDEVRRQADELRASRSRVVASADAARRQIERDLHDGAQQDLVALAINLRLTRDLVTEDPPLAEQMLDQLTASLKDAIASLRDLAHGIYPPLLVERGLVDALRAVATRSPLDVEIRAEGTGRYPGDVEAAVYFCCLEALQNASKHAPDAHVVVTVCDIAEALLFEVVDDGPGFDAEAKGRGHGFVNMSDRLGAVGGRVRWESAPGQGTTISGSVPLDS